MDIESVFGISKDINVKWFAISMIILPNIEVVIYKGCSNE